MNNDHLLKEIDRLKLKIISLRKSDNSNSQVAEDFHNSVVESAPDAIISMNSRGNIIYWNKSAERLFGFSKYEILGSTLIKIIPRRFRNDYAEWLNKALASSNSEINGKAMQLIGLHKYGKEFPVEITLSTGIMDNMRYITGIIRDTTERLEAQKLIKESQELYSLLVNNANDGIYITTPEYLEFINPAFERFSGYKFEEVCNENFNIISLIHPDDHALIKQRTKDRKAGKEIESKYEFKFITKSGDIRFVEDNTVPLPERKGKVLGMLRDITERKLYEKELNRSNEMFKVLFDSGPDAYYLNDLTGTFIDGNRAAEKMIGYKKEDLIGKNFLKLNLLNFSDIPKAAKLLGKSFLGRSTGPDEFVLNRKDGSKVTVEILTHPVEIGGRRVVLGAARDITEKKKIEKALQKAKDELEERVIERTRELHESNKDLTLSEERLKLLMEKMPEGLGVSIDGKIVFSNRENTKIFGYEKDEILNKPVAEFIHPEDRERAGKRIKEILEGADEQYSQYRMIKKDGSVFPAEVHSRTFEYEGKPALLSIIRDITERKAAESELRKKDEKFKLLLEKMPMGVRVAVDGKIVFGNREIARILGYKREKLLNMLNIDFIHPDDREWAVECTQKMVRGEEKQPGKYRMIRKDGSPFPAEVFSRMIEYDGKTAVLCLIRDITEHHRLSSELDKTLSTLGSIMDTTYDGIFVVDNEGKPVYYNDKFLDIWGLSRDTITTMDFKERIKSVLHLLIDPDAFKKRVQYFMENPEEEGYDVLEFKNGKVFERHSMPRKIDGKTVGRIWSFNDITDTKIEGQKRLVAEQRLETAKRMESLGVLAGGVAHDLNNILGPMVAYPDLLASELPEDSPMLEDLMIIKESAVSAAEVVADLLTLARRGNYKMHSLNLNDVIKSHRKSLAHSTIQDLYPNVELKTYLSSKVQNIYGSAPHLSKVVMNMINNSYEAMPYGGKLRIKTYNRSLEKQLFYNDEIPKGDYVALEFKDSGIGMNEDEISKIFEPFFTKKEMGRSGSGLGLSVVWGVVKDHKGFIDITSDEGVGTKFTLYFPVTTEKRNGKINHLSNIRGSEIIIVVDDEKKQRDVARKVLASLGYKVKCFETGTKGINYLKKNQLKLLN